MNIAETIKALAAASSVAVGCLLNPAGIPEAKAAAQSCWIVPASGASVAPFRCDVSRRTNANGPIVNDIRHFQGDGAHFSVILWTSGGNPNGAEVFIEGERFTTTWYRDGDGDARVRIGRQGVFVF